MNPRQGISGIPPGAAIYIHPPATLALLSQEHGPRDAQRSLEDFVAARGITLSLAGCRRYGVLDVYYTLYKYVFFNLYSKCEFN